MASPEIGNVENEGLADVLVDDTRCGMVAVTSAAKAAWFSVWLGGPARR